ncbi:putative lipid II flippase FtsW [Bacillaceae bacterium S4-13-58]
MKKWKHIDFILFISPIILAAVGVLMVYSASMVMVVVKYDLPSNYYLLQQLKWFVLGLLVLVFTTLFPYSKYKRLVKLIVLGTISLLIFVLFFGEVRNNAKSWIDLGFFNIQPSELTKLSVIIYLSAIYAKKENYIDNFNKAVLPPLIILVIMLGLILKQPDIGTASIIAFIGAAIIISSGIRFSHLLFLILSGVVIVILAIPKLATEEVLSRFTGAFQPFDYPDSAGYHLIQSLIAIGTGGINGVGLGQGVQKLGYLMEAHTDFIIAVIGEELGFIGVGTVIALLTAIVLRGFYISRKCEDQFGSLLAIGIASMVGIQSFVNMGAASGLLPITGVTLPFISYGGSSILVLMGAMGILNNIALNVRFQESHQPIKQVIPDEVSNVHHLKPKGGKIWADQRK